MQGRGEILLMTRANLLECSDCPGHHRSETWQGTLSPQRGTILRQAQKDGSSRTGGWRRRTRFNNCSSHQRLLRHGSAQEGGSGSRSARTSKKSKRQPNRRFLTSQLLALQPQTSASAARGCNSMKWFMAWIKCCRRAVGEESNFHTKFDSALEKYKSDPGQIEQVIMNLVINARDAMPRGGKLNISTSIHH